MEQNTEKEWQFKPGQGGRPKGVKNKVTREQKIQVETVLSMLDDIIVDYILKMKPEKVVELWFNLQEYVRPKQNRVNMEIGAKKDNDVKFTFEVVGENGLPLPDTDPRDD